MNVKKISKKEIRKKTKTNVFQNKGKKFIK